MKVAITFVLLWMLLVEAITSSQDLPSVYEYFTDNGSDFYPTGLKTGNRRFTLNGKEIRIISGAIHYFRIHPALWRDRLRKLRAVGANTVETYTAWNIHEPRKGQFDFGDGNFDFSEFADVRRFIQIAKEEDLLVLLRPGPYICGEWDFGGFPSWLQRDPELKIREYNKPYLDRVKIYFDNLLPRLSDLQFTRGGPIIALQIENEYASFSPRSKNYLQFLRDLLIAHGFGESLHYSSDNNFSIGDGMDGTLPGVLQTANFQAKPDAVFERLREIQPEMPSMGMEFWSGWFNHFGDQKQAITELEEFGTTLKTIFDKWNGSVNFYVFHGGTNFGFMAGGNALNHAPYIAADITSYDYDAPLTEAGDYTLKYEIASGLISHYAIPQLRKPPRPPQSNKRAYPTLKLERYLSYEDIIERIPSTSKFQMPRLYSMEHLPMNQDSGQSYGYVIYRTKLEMTPGTTTTYKGFYPRDVAFLLVDGKLVPEARNVSNYWINSEREFSLTVGYAGTHSVDLLVEPLTRVNFGHAEDFVQQKGMAPVHMSKIEINGKEIHGVEIIAAEFSNAWVKSLIGFTEIRDKQIPQRAPVLLEATFTIEEEPEDTWLDMRKWVKGIVFVNGFNIGRYWQIGPQKNLYVPAPLLKTGENKITIFEQVQADTEIIFSDKPDLGQRP